MDYLAPKITHRKNCKQVHEVIPEVDSTVWNKPDILGLKIITKKMKEKPQNNIYVLRGINEPSRRRVNSFCQDFCLLFLVQNISAEYGDIPRVFCHL